jgi:tetratricopeptide (TPR) repeat protein
MSLNSLFNHIESFFKKIVSPYLVINLLYYFAHICAKLLSSQTMRCLRFFCCLIFLLSPFGGYSLNSQTVQDWLHKLENTDSKQAILFYEVCDTIFKMDDINSAEAVKRLQTESEKDNERVQAKLKVLEAIVMSQHNGGKPFEYYIRLMEEALRTALTLQDDILTADICYWLAEMYWQPGKSAQAMFYIVKAIEMQEKLGPEKFPKNSLAYKIGADVLYNTGNYRQSVEFGNKAATLQLQIPPGHICGNYNTIALGYKELQQYDSALQIFNKALQLAKNINSEVWISLINGNIGDVYMLQKEYAKAKPLLEYDYRWSMQNNEKENAANSLQQVAKIYLINQQNDSALLLAKKAQLLLETKGASSPAYSRNVYQTLAMAYHAKGVHDSAWKYQQLYLQNAESVTERKSDNRLDIIQTKINYEQSLSNIKSLLKEKQAEQVKRNFLLAGIIIVLFAAFLLYQNQRLRFRFKKEQLLQEAAAAKQQLQSFTQNIIEKNEMIEHLQNQMLLQKQEGNSELLQQTILTDEDWERFQQMFEKVHPGFFNQLKKISPEITAAELRLSALIKLNISNKQMAAMQGIGADSIRKSKYRLRQRLSITVEDGLEEYIGSI